MNIRFLICLSWAVLVSCAGNDRIPADSSPVIKIQDGLIRGLVDEGVHIFKGVPFAAPPVGDFRWKAPQPVLPWTDTLQCTEFGRSPVQNDPKPFMMWTQEFITPANALGEDCLYLNVWTPATRGEKKLPVLVWIYGGGFVSGSGACPVYDGEELAKRGIVYVTINYRVGVFGFMAHPELTAESGHNASGNYGLMDQIAALRWVQDNIEAFGGDKNKVTIAGQSAGSMGVQALVASPLATSLFRGAIAQSGALTARPARALSEAEAIGVTLSQKTPSQNLFGLRALPADTILKWANTIPYGSFFPVVDGYVIPEDPKMIFASEKHNDVPVMVGWVTGDAGLLGQPQAAEQFQQTLSSTFGYRDAATVSRLFPTKPADALNVSQQKFGNLRFAGFADCEWALQNKSNSYVYEYHYVPTDKPGFPNYGAFHTSEVPFALHTLRLWERPWTEVDYAVEQYMSTYWINFVKSGDPNDPALPVWKPYKQSQGSIMRLGEKPELKDKLYAEELNLFRSITK